jgi:uncharacterized membrane protein
MLSALMTTWGVATAVLVVLLIYRAMLSNHEEDRLFLNAAEAHEEQEQIKLIGKLRSVGRFSMIFGILSGVLMLAIAGMWTYEQIMRPPIA